ncbi:uncharacterized protein LOC121936840 [Sceloporus undulatus]|uniref:uncharacterized protein LOC121936840 n=1 Tax=Sceloporus undulatus TaxID=8520 RepID=UPI001C4CED63|nr:uncharacterized protein LOC121936840 [Sceloporus undulatus]
MSYSSEEHRVTTTSSDKATSVRQERDVSVIRTISLSKILNMPDPTTDARKDKRNEDSQEDEADRRISFPSLTDGPQTGLESEQQSEKAQAKSENGSPKDEHKEGEPIQDSLRRQPSLEDEKEEVISQVLPEEDPNNPLKEQPEVPLPLAREESFSQQSQKTILSKTGVWRNESSETPPMISWPLQDDEEMEPTVYDGESTASDTPPEQKAQVPRLPPGSPSETPPPTVPRPPEIQERPTLQWAPLPNLGSDTEVPNDSQPASEEDLEFRWAPLSKEPSTVSRVIAEKSSISANKAMRGKSPMRYDIRASNSSERETVLRTETKDWSSKEEPDAAIVSILSKPALMSSSQRGRDKSFHNMVAELASQIQDTRVPQSAMVNSINAFVESPIGQVFSTTIDRALMKSEEWLNYYLPLPPTSIAQPSASQDLSSPSSLDLCKEGCFMRINSLSTQLRNRAFKYILRQVKRTRKSTGENLSLLDQVLDLIDYTGGLGSSSFPKVPEQLSGLWNEWQPEQELEGSKQAIRSGMESVSFIPEQLEMKALSLTRSLAQELYTTYHNFLPHISELPLHLQEKATQVYEGLEELQSHLALTPSLRDLPASVIVQSRERIANARENLDEILDFMSQNPPSQWLLQKSASKSGKDPLFSEGEKPLGGPENEGNVAGASSSHQTERPLPPPPPHL